ncbi:MAG: UPF0175 family protein [bacterium]
MEIPRDVLFAAGIEEERVSLELKKQLAVHLFENELLSLGKASEFAEMSRWDFMDLLGSKGIQLHYGVKEFKEDMETLKEMKL